MKEIEREQAKQHIMKIYERYQTADRILLKGFASTIRLNLQNFPSSGHFIIEFIQNADDAKSRKFDLVASDKSILITNDGNAFDFDDVESICNSASSNKSPEYNLGYLGVGFKSCFKISNSPEIRSGNYRFKFDKEEIGNPDLPYELMPIWLDDAIGNGGTLFNLPLIDDNKTRQIIADQLFSDTISGKLILFLKNLEEIKISADIADKRFDKTIRKTSSSMEGGDYRIYKTEEEMNNAPSSNRWAVFRKAYDVPESISQDQLTIQFKRENIRKREVLIAMELDEEGRIMLGKGSIHFGVYSFLPLRDLSTTFRFIIQGDFLTNPGRSDIHREAAWNIFIAECVYDLIANVCIPAVLKNEMWKYEAGRIFHVDLSANEVINKHIIEPLQNYVNVEPMLFDVNDNLVSARNAITMSGEVIDLLGADLIAELYGKSPLNDKVAYDGKMPNLERGPDSIIEFMNDSAAKILFVKYISEKNMEWFKAFYRKLLSHGFDERDLRELTRISFIVDNGFNLIAPEEARIAIDLHLPESKLSEFKIVHTSLYEDDLLTLFRSVLKINDLTPDDIREVNQYTPEQWEQLAKDERIDYIRYLFTHPNRQLLPSTYLTLPTKVGDWAKPEELVFPMEYSPGYDVEKLISKGLLKIRIPKFVSPELFLDETDKKSQWREFLTNLGCNNEGLLEDIEEEIGVESVRLLEEKNGCKVEDPRPSGLNEDPGYDLRSIDKQGNIKLVEIKSGRERYGLNISLSRNQHRALFKKNEPNTKNYVYAVKNVLDEPEINVIEGDDILSLTARLLINETGKDGWSKICKGKFNII